MSSYIIKGGNKLEGTVKISGAMIGKYHKATFTYPGDCDI